MTTNFHSLTAQYLHCMCKSKSWSRWSYTEDTQYMQLRRYLSKCWLRKRSKSTIPQ